MLRHIIIKMSKIKDEKILKAASYIKGKWHKTDFSAETLQASREWHDIN